MWRADGKWCLILLHSVFSPYGQVIKLQLADSDYLVSRPTLTSWLHRVAQTRKCTMYTGLRSVNFIVSNLFAGDGSGVENYSNLFYTHLATYLPLILLWQPISKSYSQCPSLLSLYIMVTLGHLRVTIGHFRVTIGHHRITIGRDNRDGHRE